MENVRNIVTEALGKIKERGGLKAVYFVACGGSQAAIYPGKYLLAQKLKSDCSHVVL